LGESYENLSKEDLIELVKALTRKVAELEKEIRLLKNGHKSDTSSTPPSVDIGRSNRVSLREKSGKKSGGQKGHKGSTLKQKSEPDEVIKERPRYCSHCGASLDGIEGRIKNKRQEFDIKITEICREYQNVSIKCSHCGKETEGGYPDGIKGAVQYSPRIKALIGYLSVDMRTPYNQIASFFKDIIGIPLSEGTVDNALASLDKKAELPYKEIKRELEKSAIIGSDETGCHVKTENDWAWVWQNERLTYIVHSKNRAYSTIEREFPAGFHKSTLVSDSLSAQLKTPAAKHQLCIAHLLRELTNFTDALKSKWAFALKGVFEDALALKKRMTDSDYKHPPPEIHQIELDTDLLLSLEQDGLHKKLKAFIKRLKKHRDSLFTFLYDKDVPPDNNGSERAIRNIKVKTKISGQFRSDKGADRYATIRSVVDTAIKNNQNLWLAFNAIANYCPT
jgi:transposase